MMMRIARAWGARPSNTRGAAMRSRASFVTVGALCCLSVAAAPALADGLPGRGSIKDTSYAPGSTWSGVYLGVFAGGTWSKDRWSSDETSPAAGAPIDLNSNDFTGGGLVGANLQMGRWVWGAELDVGFLNGGRTLNFDGMADVQSIKSEINWNGHARLRFGYDGGRFMPFIAGGLAFPHSASVARPNDTTNCVPGHRWGPASTSSCVTIGWDAWSTSTIATTRRVSVPLDQ